MTLDRFGRARTRRAATSRPYRDRTEATRHRLSSPHHRPAERSRVATLVTAAALAAAGGLWIALQPAATHSGLDDAFSGSLLRFYFYLPPTVIGVALVASILDWTDRSPVVMAIALATAAVTAGTIAETVARIVLGHGDVLAADGVLQRVLELVRVDVPVCSVAALVLVPRPAAMPLRLLSGGHARDSQRETSRAHQT